MSGSRPPPSAAKPNLTAHMNWRMSSLGAFDARIASGSLEGFAIRSPGRCSTELRRSQATTLNDLKQNHDDPQ